MGIRVVNQSLIESERRLRGVLDAAVDAIITINERGIVESMNPAGERIFGYIAEEVVGKNISILMPQPYRDAHDGYLKHYLDTGEKKIIGIGREVIGMRKDGSTFPMDLAVSEVTLPDRKLFTGIVRDITDRKRAEAAVTESERKLSTLISNLPGAAYRCLNDADWTLKFISDGCRELCGYTPAELLAGKPTWAEVIEDEDRDEVRCNVQSKLALRQPFQAAYRIRHRNGEQRWAWEHGQGVFSEGGELLALEGFIADTTELQKAREDLVQSERLAAMGQMLSGIAHESRNALQRIQASVDLLSLELEGHPEASEEIARIARAREDLQRLFEELRNFAAPIHLDLSRCDLSKIWQQAWDHLESSMEGRVTELSVDTGGIDLSCKVDAFRMVQVFRNLMENSLSACSDPVRIEIESCVTSLEGAPALCICVRDNGPGLSEDQRAHIFDAFYTTKTKGTGLGMAIAQRVVEAHGGIIRVGTCRHGGAEFEVILPRSP